MDLLKNEKLDKTLVSLENETGVQLYDYNREISFLRQLVLDGHWIDAEEFLKPLIEHPKFEYNSSIFEIRKQKFLEAVEQDPENKNNNVEELVDLLKDLQYRCSASAFNQLVFCLSSPSITDHIEYKNWTPLSGRLKCFAKLREYLEMIYPINKEEIKIATGSFNILLKNLILNKTSFSTKNNINFSLLDDKFLRDSTNENTQVIIEDDLKQRVKIPKDDIELLKKSNTALKAMRNEKISQSLKVNKISEIEDDDVSDPQSKDNEEEMNSKMHNVAETGNGNKNVLFEIPEKVEKIQKNAKKEKMGKYEKIEEENKNSPNKNKTEDNCNENFEIDIENEEQYKNINNNQSPYTPCKNKYLKYQDNDLENSSNNILNINQKENALSDLDVEEYYMKSQYEYYDYDITTLSQKKVIQDTNPIRTSCFSPKGDYFAIGTNSKSVKIFQMRPILQKFNKKNSYNYKDNKESNNNNLINDDIKLIFEQKNHHLGSIYCLDWSISGRLIASGSNDKLVKLMVIPDLEESYGQKDQETLELTISGHKGTIRSVSFEPTSDLVLLSAGTVDTCIKVWDAEKGSNITNLEGHTNDINTIKWSNDALICASSGADKTVRFWDLRDYKSTSLINALKYPDVNDISIYTKNKNMASTLLAAGHADGTISIWDYNKRNIIKEIFEHNEEVRSVSFSPDGKYLASASFDSKIKIFDVDNNFDLIGELEHLDRVVSVKWHPEVPLLISTSADKTARVWIPEY